MVVSVGLTKVAIGPFSFAQVKQVSLTLTWFISRLKYKRECLDKMHLLIKSYVLPDLILGRYIFCCGHNDQLIPQTA